MRLVEVEIENYKQYAGTHVFRPGEKAMVAIVGQNGAGKTTLFEAIEWCLYNPSRIKNDSLTPRVQGGKPRVRVVIEDPHSGIVYEVERLLKGGSTQAEIYRQDQPESPIVQGTRQVTEYVARELTGLSHTAFVATFFTRQKELSFFGDLGATQRREQVGRLLGLETIRVAQKRFGEQRTRKQAEARVKRDQYEEQSRGIDFPAERQQLDLAIAEQTAQRDAARSDVAICTQQTSLATASRDLAQQRFAAHAGLLNELTQITGEQRRCEEVRDTAERDLEAIANAEAEVAEQRGAAANEPALRQRLALHDAEKAKLEESDRLAAELKQLLIDRQAIASTVAQTGRIAESADISSVYGAQALVSLVDTEIVRLSGIDLDSLRIRNQRSGSLLNLAAQRDSAIARLETMEKLSEELNADLEALLVDGSPAERLAEVRKQRQQLQEDAASARSVASHTEQRAGQLATLERSLNTSELGEVCPTCARPFQPGEAVRTLEALAEQVRLLHHEVTQNRARATDLDAQSAKLAEGELVLSRDGEQLLVLQERLVNGSRMMEEQRETIATIQRDLDAQLCAMNRQEPPLRSEIERMEAELAAAEVEYGRLPRFEVGREQLLASIERQDTIGQRIAALGPVDYDIDTHRRDHAEWSIARDAQARIEELQKQVARRSEREAARSEANTRLVSLQADRTRVDGDIAALDFDKGEVENANQLFAKSLDQERAATAAAHAAEQQLASAKRGREDLDKFEMRLKALADESAAAEVSAGELDRVYREFARFEQYVAVAVTPVLGEIASELLDKATDGKYDRLEFTEDYGIEVYDGENDRFPLSQYSGGERDVIALCARLALSQVIGGQAATPIKFMVLDEVFGSLDPDRRRNLMEMLQRLMEENQAFQQLFVISHVDDVRAASMFDEVWKVSESADGVSHLEQVSVTGSIEDY